MYLVQVCAITGAVQVPGRLLPEVRCRAVLAGDQGYPCAVWQVCSKLKISLDGICLINQFLTMTTSGLCWWATPGGMSPRSLEAQERTSDTRSPAVKRWQSYPNAAAHPLNSYSLLWWSLKAGTPDAWWFVSRLVWTNALWESSSLFYIKKVVQLDYPDNGL